MSNAICQSNQDLPDSMVLGNLLFYSLSDMKVSESDLFTVFTQCNLPVGYIRKISPSDVFRRATSSVKNSTVFIPDPTTGLNLKMKIDVDEVRCDDQVIKRIIGVKRINEANEEVSYDQMGVAVFDRAHPTLSNFYTVHPYDGITDCEDIMLKIEQNFNDWCVFHTKDTVRNIVNRIVQDTHPVSLTPTGLCKFIPKSHTDLLYGLKEAVTQLQGYSPQVSGNFMEIIPVIDTEEQRNLIKNASELELKDNLFAFTQELKEVLQNRTVLPAKTVTSYLNRFKTLKEQVDDYEGLLGNYLGFLRTQITEATKLIHDNSAPEEEEDTKPYYV